MSPGAAVLERKKASNPETGLECWIGRKTLIRRWAGDQKWPSL
jgi:hypothetical protein